MTVKPLANEPATDRRGHRALEAQVPHLFNTQRRRSRPRRHITYIHSPLSLDMSTIELLPTAQEHPDPASTIPNVSMKSIPRSDVSMRTRSRSSSRSSQALAPAHATPGYLHMITQYGPLMATNIPLGSDSRSSSASANQELIGNLQEIVAVEKTANGLLQETIAQLQQRITQLETEMKEARKEVVETHQQANEKVEKANEKVDKANEKVDKANERVAEAYNDANKRVAEAYNAANEKVDKANEKVEKAVVEQATARVEYVKRVKG
ncbi:hypothetical protein BDW22DRAFT_1361202 [Trametopsis cervina]|nr:hypothetical protein BDW22DRAFT_1361202 [Trametopsis cervina]